MAEVTGFRNNALPYPVYGVPYGIVFPILDGDGDVVSSAADLDSEVSLNGDTFADCTNEAAEVAVSSGIYYLLLTAAEMTADVVTVVVKTSTSGAKSTVVTMYPRKLVALRSDTAQGGDSGYITLDASAGSVDDIWNGCLVVATIDSVVEARIISDYSGTTQQASVSPGWNTAPDDDDTFVIYDTETRQFTDVSLSSAVNTAIANEVWAIDMSTVSGAADRSPLNAIRVLRNKWSISGGTMTVRQENDSTVAWTATLTSDSSASPVVSQDPA